MDLEKLFNPSAIAIIGATDEGGKVGTAITKNVLNLGYSGKVFLVNPKHNEMFGRKCYPSLLEIEEQIDLAIIIIPAKFVNQVIQDCADLVKNFVIISAGFSEIGEKGKKLENELLEIAKIKEVNILGPNCLGFINSKAKLNASFAGGLPKQGNIAFVSQSGALISAILDISKKENLGFSSVISIGNKMQIDESDFFEYLENDNETKVIGMYLEGIKDGKKFKELTGKISKEKPVVILKAGKTEKSQKAISSHTGALAGSEKITKALFQKTGIIEAENFDEFLNLLKLISFSQAPQNEKVIVITNAGGPGVLTTDSFFEKEMVLEEVPNEIKGELREFLPQESSLQNPIDLLGDAQEDRYEKSLETVKKAEQDSIILVLTPQENTPTEKIAQKIVEFKKNWKKTVVSVFLGSEKIEKSLEILSKGNVPNFSSPEKAVSALEKYYQWEVNKNKIEIKKITQGIENSEKNKAKEIIAKAKSEGRKALFFREAKEIMDIYQINTIEFQEISNEKELEIDFPMAMKVDSEKILHKTDKQGVILGIKNEDDFRKAYQKMSENFPKENIIIQPMKEIKNEIIIGIKKDKIVGPVVVFGLGGIYTEVFKLVDFLIPPLTISEIKKVILKSPVRFLFEKTRGQEPCNIEKFAEILFKISILAQDLEEINEFDINPLLIYNDERSSLVIDVKIIV